jgi:hypothetical protein
MPRPAWCREVLQVLLVLFGGAALMTPTGLYGSYWWVPLASMAAVMAYPWVMDWGYGVWLSVMCKLERLMPKPKPKSIPIPGPDEQLYRFSMDYLEDQVTQLKNEVADLRGKVSQLNGDVFDLDSMRHVLNEIRRHAESKRDVVLLDILSKAMGL